ncbi:unnamed protein product [Ostreobium quekettii]|uniref:Uncharacterized protein n=1 Tax=Ostreobium quekettii TaxID=121088 RepID=A0A8S1IY48_9CHLO|nr:unnamed protein product [Ostreobium quekettii]
MSERSRPFWSASARAGRAGRRARKTRRAAVDCFLSMTPRGMRALARISACAPARESRWTALPARAGRKKGRPAAAVTGGGGRAGGPRGGARHISCTSTNFARSDTGEDEDRPRERQRDRREQLEVVATRLEERTALYDSVDRENVLLREANERLAALVAEQQAVIDRMQGEMQRTRRRDSLVRQLSDPGLLHGSLQASGSKISTQAPLRSAGQGPDGQQLGVGLGHMPQTSSGLDQSMLAPLSPALDPSPFASGSHDSHQLPHQQRFGRSTSPSSSSGVPAGRIPMVQVQGHTVSPFSTEALQQRHSAHGPQYIDAVYTNPQRVGTSPQWGFLETGQPGAAGPSNPDLGSLLQRTQEQLSLAPVQGFRQGLHEEQLSRPRRASSGLGAPPLVHLPGAGAGTAAPSPGFEPSLPREGSISSGDLSTGVAVNLGGLMGKMEMQVRALQDVLDSHAICNGSKPVSAPVAQMLGDMVSNITETEVSIARLRTPRPSDLVSTSQSGFQVHLTLEEMEKFRKCLAMLGLNAYQKDAMVELRAEHLACLRRILEERYRLNVQAAAALRAGGAGSKDMRLVWDLVKRNVGQEQQAFVDGLRRVLLSILEPTQAALLLVEVHPGSVDVAKLTTAVAVLGGEGSGGTTSHM